MRTTVRRTLAVALLGLALPARAIIPSFNATDPPDQWIKIAFKDGAASKVAWLYLPHVKAKADNDKPVYGAEGFKGKSQVVYDLAVPLFELSPGSPAHADSGANRTVNIKAKATPYHYLIRKARTRPTKVASVYRVGKMDEATQALDPNFEAQQDDTVRDNSLAIDKSSEFKAEFPRGKTCVVAAAYEVAQVTIVREDEPIRDGGGAGNADANCDKDADLCKSERDQLTTDDQAAFIREQIAARDANKERAALIAAMKPILEKYRGIIKETNLQVPEEMNKLSTAQQADYTRKWNEAGQDRAKRAAVVKEYRDLIAAGGQQPGEAPKTPLQQDIAKLFTNAIERVVVEYMVESSPRKAQLVESMKSMAAADPGDQRRKDFVAAAQADVKKTVRDYLNTPEDQQAQKYSQLKTALAGRRIETQHLLDYYCPEVRGGATVASQGEASGDRVARRQLDQAAGVSNRAVNSGTDEGSKQGASNAVETAPPLVDQLCRDHTARRLAAAQNQLPNSQSNLTGPRGRTDKPVESVGEDKTTKTDKKDDPTAWRDTIAGVKTGIWAGMVAMIFGAGPAALLFAAAGFGLGMLISKMNNA